MCVRRSDLLDLDLKDDPAWEELLSSELPPGLIRLVVFADSAPQCFAFELGTSRGVLS